MPQLLRLLGHLLQQMTWTPKLLSNRRSGNSGYLDLSGSDMIWWCVDLFWKSDMWMIPARRFRIQTKFLSSDLVLFWCDYGTMDRQWQCIASWLVKTLSLTQIQLRSQNTGWHWTTSNQEESRRIGKNQEELRKTEDNRIRRRVKRNQHQRRQIESQISVRCWGKPGAWEGTGLGSRSFSYRTKHRGLCVSRCVDARLAHFAGFRCLKLTASNLHLVVYKKILVSNQR